MIVKETALSGKTVNITFKDEMGNWITINNAHLDTTTVTSGQRVRAGDQIGTEGNTGNAANTRTHLHFGVYKNGESIDPSTYLPDLKYPDEQKKSGSDYSP